MSNNKQSSVEWLIRQYEMKGYIGVQDEEQAKAMHKEEIKQAIMFGDCRGQIDTYATSEQYYNETFGGEDEQQ